MKTKKVLNTQSKPPKNYQPQVPYVFMRKA